MMKIRVGALVAAAAMVLTFAGAALANDQHQPTPIAWDAASFQGSASECSGLDLKDGEVYWHFIQTQVASDTTTGKLTATFTVAGVQVVDSYKKSGDVLHWSVITGPDTLLSFSSNVTSLGNLNLSHICSGPTPTPTASLPEVTPTPTASLPEVTPTPTASLPEVTPTPTASLPEVTPTPTASLPEVTPTPTAKPSSSVDAETGTPEVTPPSTDSIGNSGSSTPGGLPIVLAVIAGLLAAALIVTPRRARR